MRVTETGGMDRCSRFAAVSGGSLSEATCRSAMTAVKDHGDDRNEGPEVHDRVPWTRDAVESGSAVLTAMKRERGLSTSTGRFDEGRAQRLRRASSSLSRSARAASGDRRASISPSS